MYVLQLKALAMAVQWHSWRHTRIAWLTVFAVFSVRYALESR
jgi:hypothetical protein